MRSGWPTTPSTAWAAVWCRRRTRGPSTSPAGSGPASSRRRRSGSEPLSDLGPGGGQGPGWGADPKGIGQSGAFGGYKQSGLGREWGRHGLEDFTEVKNLVWS